MAIVDQWGRPIKTQQLTQEIAAPKIAGIRQVWHASVSAGLTPGRLADILQSAAEGDAYDYLTLAEEMEEKDAHYFSVLSTRKLAVAGLEVSVTPASDDAEDERRAEAVREIVNEPDFGDLIFDLVDAIGKGYSVAEIMWHRTGSAWWPDRYECRDQRHFRYDRETGRELRLLDEADQVNGVALAPYKFVVHQPRLRTTLPVRGGLARMAAVSYMCKAWSWRDWMAFADIFGLPMRVGRYGPAASNEDIQKLLSAVANLGSDAAAAIPQSMNIEFQEAANTSGSGDFFERLTNWWDRQVSKAILGQTMTSDDGASLSQAQVHNDVRLDLLSADAKALSNTLNRQLIRPFVDLNFGADRRYPRIKLVVPEPENTSAWVESISKLVPLGFRVPQSAAREKLGIPEPDDDAELLAQPEPAASPFASAFNREHYRARNREAPPSGGDVADRQQQRLSVEAAPAIDDMIDSIRELVDQVSSMEELRDRLVEVYPQLTNNDLADVMADAFSVAQLAGRDDITRGV
ncbi:hypothetical protein R84981_001716 [Carnimonas sp. R-84981]|uniref:DUF935 domain-containing protein n=1 Tax=Carnimonas bestiolae TaxID=3402172 RepID=UPI003EDC2843